MDKITLGKSGENLAVEFLKNKGYKIVARNFKTKLGEIDIIAKQKDTICFIEVRTRASSVSGSAEESVDTRKQHRLSRLALSYLKNYKLLESPARFDVVCVHSQEDAPRIELIEDAFDLSPQYSY